MSKDLPILLQRTTVAQRTTATSSVEVIKDFGRWKVLLLAEQRCQGG